METLKSVANQTEITNILIKAKNVALFKSRPKDGGTNTLTIRSPVGVKEDLRDTQVDGADSSDETTKPFIIVNNHDNFF